MRLLDPQNFQFTGDANYLNHPPPFYDLLAVLGPRLEGRPQALLAHRLIDIAIARPRLRRAARPRARRAVFPSRILRLRRAAGLHSGAGADRRRGQQRQSGVSSAAPLAMLGAWQLLRPIAWPGSLSRCRFGRGAWAKLTGFLLTGAMLGAVARLSAVATANELERACSGRASLSRSPPRPTLYFSLNMAVRRRRRRRRSRCCKMAPEPPAGPTCRANLFPAYMFISSSPLSPTGCRRSASAARSIFDARYSGRGARLCVRPASRCRCVGCGGGEKHALDVVVIAGTMALAATFAIHVTYSYGRHLSTGWMMDAYPRYYLPLAASCGSPGSRCSPASNAPRWRAGLLTFLIAGPILFRIFGAPLG